MATWKKSPQSLIDAFAGALPDDPRVVPKPMFGYPAAFTDRGHMFAGLWQEHMVVRLGEDDREALRKLNGASIFEPMKGRQMKEYTIVPAAMHDKPADLKKWLARALAFVAEMPAKTKKPAKKKASTPKKKTAAKKRR